MDAHSKPDVAKSSSINNYDSADISRRAFLSNVGTERDNETTQPHEKRRKMNSNDGCASTVTPSKKVPSKPKDVRQFENCNRMQTDNQDANRRGTQVAAAPLPFLSRNGNSNISDLRIPNLQNSPNFGTQRLLCLQQDGTIQESTINMEEYKHRNMAVPLNSKGFFETLMRSNQDLSNSGSIKHVICLVSATEPSKFYITLTSSYKAFIFDVTREPTNIWTKVGVISGFENYSAEEAGRAADAWLSKNIESKPSYHYCRYLENGVRTCEIVCSRIDGLTFQTDFVLNLDGCGVSLGGNLLPTTNERGVLAQNLVTPTKLSIAFDYESERPSHNYFGLNQHSNDSRLFSDSRQSHGETNNNMRIGERECLPVSLNEEILNNGGGFVDEFANNEVDDYVSSITDTTTVESIPTFGSKTHKVSARYRTKCELCDSYIEANNSIEQVKIHNKKGIAIRWVHQNCSNPLEPLNDKVRSEAVITTENNNNTLTQTPVSNQFGCERYQHIKAMTPTKHSMSPVEHGVKYAIPQNFDVAYRVARNWVWARKKRGYPVTAFEAANRVTVDPMLCRLVAQRLSREFGEWNTDTNVSSPSLPKNVNTGNVNCISILLVLLCFKCYSNKI